MPKNTIKSTIGKTLKEFPDVKISYLFGSSIKNRTTPSSDIDIAIAADSALSFTEKKELQEN
ncbi:MAG: nucleotidyltransferase domain-containing protein [Desulfobacula sp.]|uniref:nucleotidyltransferase domain-containing protein n=1 Tax=Desulfobacula sp. TaxID=2593537 RepID=UPI0039B933CC|nr:nucleotidyltransferase domain-containing protein [Desulfobacula sp.]